MSGLHFKKDGSLDMRYSSSKAAVASGYGSSSSGFGSSAAVASGYGSSSSGFGSSASFGIGSSSVQSSGQGSYGAYSSGDSDLHRKKDGSLDMRYASSKQAVATGHGSSSSYYSPVRDDLHHKKDGSLDMRYKSSKQAASFTSQVNRLADAIGRLNLKQSRNRSTYNIPSTVPTKADGTPDMRTNAAKEWVKDQAAVCQYGVPDWVPKKKDGTINMSTAIGRAFADAKTETVDIERLLQQSHDAREEYYRQRMADDSFYRTVMNERQQSVCLPQRASPIIDTLTYQQPSRYSSTYSGSESLIPSVEDWAESIPDSVPLVAYQEILFGQDSLDDLTLGRGSFGVVLKAQWKGLEVAVKKLHLDKLTRKEKDSFCKELQILAHLGTHENLVKLHGYCLDPPCIIMELVSLGSLSHLLHYCEDPALEAKMTDGRIKKNLIFGTANGMLQLHLMKIVHGDIKPQNILVTDLFVAKVTDFGLSTLRGKSQSSVASKQFDDHDGEATMIGGTAGYMAPELLDFGGPPELSSDVYSFGIVVNEVVSEEEPYSDQYQNFHGRGPFAAAMYAKQGQRPNIKPSTPSGVQQLIKRCWSADPHQRPTFDEIITIIENPSFVIPNSC